MSSGSDQAGSARDQLASDRDQATADRADRGHRRTPAEERAAHQESRIDRQTATIERQAARLERGRATADRQAAADARDRTAAERDDVAALGDAATAEVIAAGAEAPDASLVRQLEELRAQAGADRARAAVERARAATDRARLLREQARLEAELQSMHLDDLTGAYRRDVGRAAITHEIARARRSDGRFVVAFVDVDDLKGVNDREGHAAGDQVLRTVAATIRGGVRSFDPIVRYGGDEFVCGLSGTDTDEAERRFAVLAQAIKTTAGVGISVGFASLTETDTADDLAARADIAMLATRARRRQVPMAP